MEDILDEWHYALVNHRTESQNETVCCSFIPSPLSCLCFKKLGDRRTKLPAKPKVWCSFIPSPSCLCFKKLGVRHTVGIKIQDVKAKLDKILNEKDKFNFVPSLSPSYVEPKPLRGQSTSSIDQAKVQSLDIHKNKNEIVRRLMDVSDIKLLSIVGMGGLGKTTLAQLVYNDTQVKDHFDLSIWICVSDTFDVAKIAREIVESVTKEIIPPNTSQLELVLQELRGSISGKKFLLVLDDVWTEKYQEWEPLKINLGHGAAGSKILVTSRNMRVAKMMGSLEQEIYYPRHLSDEECWSLLRHIALPEVSEEECREFEGVGMKIAGKCKGLPLAANVLGSLLQFKDLKGWGDVLESEIWQLEEAKVDLFPHLLLSYNELSPALKRCFSYCAVYPKDSNINAERLIEEWMAQGYLGSVRGNGGVEVKGRDYFNSLAMRSLFQDVERSDGSIVGCKMHDIVHDFALFLRGNNNNRSQEGDAAAAMTKSSCQFCSPLLVSQVQEYRSLSLVLDEESPMNVCDCLASVRVLRVKRCFPLGMKKLIHLRWLELNYNSMSEEDIKSIHRLYFLQSLKLSFCFFKNIPLEIGNLVELRHLDLSCNYSLTVLPAEIGNLVELRHLDLSGNEDLKVLPAEIGKLAKLRHLDLSLNRELKELPESMCNLVELQILNLKGCFSLQGLPEGIHRLQNLQHLVIVNTPASRRLPRGLGELSGLRTLQTHIDGGSSFNELGLLKKLNSLIGSLELRINYNGDAEELVKDAQEANLRSKIHIHTLSIAFKKEGSSSSSLWMELMEALEPNQQKLNKLTIHGYRASRLPQWISSPLSLVKEISLKYCYELSSLPPFGNLPCLELLIVVDLQVLKFVGREFLGIESPSSSSSSSTKGEEVAFPKLKKLDISNCRAWSEWEDITSEEEECSAVSIMPCLEKLHIEGCRSLKKLPDHLLRKASSSLRSLIISGSTLLESQYGDKEGSGWRSITQNNPHLQFHYGKNNS